MKISTNTLRFINTYYESAGDPAATGVDDLVRRIGAQLGAVEETVPFGERYNGVLIVKIVSCEDHPDADRLHVCKIDDGGKTTGVERDENGYVQVVCGAPNVRAGINVAWLAPGVTVPETYGTQDPFVLEARPLRGVLSNGMLASPRELAIGDSHEGILEVEDNVPAGAPFTEAFDLAGDTIITIENKMFTHRPDCFGWLGVAREIEGIYHRPYKSPAWYRTDPEFPAPAGETLKLTVRNELPELVPRFTAITMRNVKVGPSPVWLQIELAKAGVRSINNIVDYTNFFMLETSQPLHAYDYDKVMAQDAAQTGPAGNAGATIVVRHPKAGEKITLLNGKEVEPRAEAIMIATETKLLGIGGVMGGGDTEVDETTTNIIIECATFDMYSIRRTAMAHGLFTDAVTRFNKGQSPLQNLAVLAKIVEEIQQYAHGEVASVLIDDNHLPAEVVKRQSLYSPVAVSAPFINARLGLGLSAAEMAGLLTNVEFRVDVGGEDLTVTAPFWRTDIAEPEDVVEEIGRLYGFDRLPLTLPKHDLTPAPKDADYALKFRIANILARAGANEVLTYNFIHGDLITRADQRQEQAFRLGNALSPDLQFLRMSLTPSLLEKVHSNIKAGYDEFALFEMNKTHNKLHTGDDEDGLPREFMALALTYAANDKKAAGKRGAAYYQARTFLDFLGAKLGLSLVYRPFDAAVDYPVTRPFDLVRSAQVIDQVSGTLLGMVGEYKLSVGKKLKLPRYSAGFELDMSALRTALETAGSRYLALPRFPKVTQDICLKVAADVTYQALYEFAWEQLQGQLPDNALATLDPVDIYQREDDAAHKQITLRLSIASYERTLTDTEVAKLLDHITMTAAEHFQAERV